MNGRLRNSCRPKRRWGFAPFIYFLRNIGLMQVISEIDW
jgi:hypothetical protein